MANYCNFSVYMIGNLKDIRKVDKIFENSKNYVYYIKPEIGKSLNILDDPNSEQYNYLILSMAKKAAKDKGNKKAIEALKDENLKKEMFVNIPDAHLHSIRGYTIDKNPEPVTYYGEDFKNVSKSYYVSKSNGDCEWSIRHCMTDEDASLYRSLKPQFPRSIFSGVTLRIISEMFPTMRLCVIGKNPIGNSEMIVVHNGRMLFNGSASIDKYYKNDNFIYTSYSPWYISINGNICPNEDFIFNILSLITDDK